MLSRGVQVLPKQKYVNCYVNLRMNVAFVLTSGLVMSAIPLCRDPCGMQLKLHKLTTL